MTVVINGTTGISGVDGSAGTPAVQGTDTNTGIYYSAADTVDVATGGVQRGQFDSSGNFKFNSGYGSAATAYGCRAWVNFNGTGTVAIRASGNVTSITDNQVGDYTINFTTAISDANYAVTGSIRNTQIYGAIQSGAPVIAQSTAPTTTALRITTPTMGDNNIRANIDSDYVSITIFR